MKRSCALSVQMQCSRNFIECTLITLLLRTMPWPLLTELLMGRGFLQSTPGARAHSHAAVTRFPMSSGDASC
eukprot:1526238-Rhodomonas_salina.1